MKNLIFAIVLVLAVAGCASIPAEELLQCPVVDVAKGLACIEGCGRQEAVDLDSCVDICKSIADVTESVILDKTQ